MKEYSNSKKYLYYKFTPYYKMKKTTLVLIKLIRN